MSPENGQAAFAPDHADRCPEGATPEFAPPPRRAGAPAPRPLWITAAGHTCLAWWHAPAARADAGPALPLAAVLASSWGEEDVAGYDRLHALAVALAEGGLGALRFEWPDTGDSSAATGTTTVADALAAFDAAATHALALSGHARLAFVGLRLGALLAAHAAVAREDVDALVALSPVAGGRAFVREQGAQDVRVPARAPVGTAHSVFDAAELSVSLAGFSMSVRRLEALSHLKWPSPATTSVLEAVVLQAPQSPLRTAADALARMGIEVLELANEGWTIGPSAGGAPAVGTAPIVDWLRERAADATVLRGVPAIENFGVADPGNGRIHEALASARLEAATTAVLALSAAPPPTWMRLRAGAGAVALRERVVLLQEPHKPTLAAVLSERDAGSAAIDRPLRRAVLLLSSGDGRRIGPQRAWVAWARHRAALGDVSLRLDVGGVGDSAAQGPTAHDDRVIDDVRRAVAWLRRELGVRDCTIVGAGPGAAQAWRAALAGVDVQHVVAIAPTDLGGIVRERDARDTSAVLRALRRCSHDVARFLRKTHQDALAAAATRAGARGVTLSLAGVSRERGLALVRHEMGRAGLALVSDRRVSVHQLVLADPAFASPAGRVELCRHLDALLHAFGARPASVDAAPRRHVARART